MKLTLCVSSARISRSGSRGATSDTSSSDDKTIYLLHLAKPVFGSQSQYPRNIVEHGAIDAPNPFEASRKSESGSSNQPLECPERRIRVTKLDSGDYGLGRSRASGELPLGEAGHLAGGGQEAIRSRGGFHTGMIAT